MVINISALCTRGKLKGVEFVAKQDRSGRYVLNRRQPTHAKDPTNKAVNKRYVATLDEAVDLLRTNEYLINLVAPNGVRALRAFDKVTIQAA